MNAIASYERRSAICRRSNPDVANRVAIALAVRAGDENAVRTEVDNRQAVNDRVARVEDQSSESARCIRPCQHDDRGRSVPGLSGRVDRSSERGDVGKGALCVDEPGATCGVVVAVARWNVEEDVGGRPRVDLLNRSAKGALAVARCGLADTITRAAVGGVRCRVDGESGLSRGGRSEERSAHCHHGN